MEQQATARLGTPSKLGEELPVFCEKCGYSLHGLPQVRCGACTVLHFHCPECGHHQPINTLRPAAQRIIGRVRSAWLVWVVIFKLNFFGWLLFAWAGISHDALYGYTFSTRTITVSGQPRQVTEQRTIEARPLRSEHWIVYGLFGLSFAAVGRLMLLRWRKGWVIGLVLAALVVLAMSVGILMRGLEQSKPEYLYFSKDHLPLVVYTVSLMMLGAIFVWPVWVALVKALIPARTADSLLEWQRAQSEPAVAELSRD